MNVITVCIIPLVLNLSFGIGKFDELTFKPIALEKDGPLLFFVRPEDAEGRPYSIESSRTEVLYVFSPANHDQPQPIWRGDVPVPELLARLNQRQVLLDYKQRLFVLHLDTGVVAPMLDGEDQTEIVEAKSGRVLFLHRSVPQTSFGSTLETNAGGATVIKEYYRPRDFIYAWDIATRSEPELLSESPIEKVLHVDEHSIWAITADDDRKLCKIPKHGGGTDVVHSLDNHLVASETYCHFSPNQRYLALTYLNDQHDFHKERELIVIDLEAKRIVCSVEKVTPLFPTYALAPFLRVAWLDESRLSYGYDRPIVLDVSNGARVEEDQANTNIRQRTGLVPLKRTTIGYFDREHGLLYYRGEEKPVVNVLDDENPHAQIREMAICPQGNWAAFLSPQDPNTYIVDGRNRKKELLFPGWSHSLTWLPSANWTAPDRLQPPTKIINK